MEQTEFTRQIDKHEAMLKKNNTVSGIVGYTKLLLFLLIGVSLFFIFVKSFKVEIFILILVEASTLIVLWIYHYKVRGKISHSNEIIAINKGHLDRLTGMWAAIPDIETGFTDNDSPYYSDLDIAGNTSFSQLKDSASIGHGRQASVNGIKQLHFSEDELAKHHETIAERRKEIDLSNNTEHNLFKNGASSSGQILNNELQDRYMNTKSNSIKFLLM